MTAIAPAAPKRPAGLLVILILASLAGAPLILLSALPLMFSPMLFDAGGTPTAWAIFIAVWLSPVVLLAGLVIAWIAFAARAYRAVYAGFAVAALPALPLAALIVFMILG